MYDAIAKTIRDHADQGGDLEALVPDIEAAAAQTVNALESGKKVLACGNGGSAAQSQHFTGELVGRFEVERSGLPAVPLTADPASLTAIANDFGYDQVFARQVEALGTAGDVLFGLSTSGESSNVLTAVARARDLDLVTVGLTGSPGGRLREVVDHSIVVPATNTARVQEAHLVVLHAICAEVDSSVGGAAEPMPRGSEA